MIASTGGCLRLVRTWSVANAPTGESGRYETEDGRVWKDHYGPETTITGVEYRDIKGGEMCPRSMGYATTPPTTREPNRKERRAARSRRR